MTTPPSGLPIDPLLAAIEAHGGLDYLLDRADITGHAPRKRYTELIKEANERGWLTPRAVDNFTVTLLGLHPYFVYGEAWYELDDGPDIETMIELREQCMSYGRIAEAMGCTEAIVTGALRREAKAHEATFGEMPEWSRVVPERTTRAQARKLTAEQAQEIRERGIAGGHGIAVELAREFGVAAQTVRDIINRKTWRQLEAAA